MDWSWAVAGVTNEVPRTTGPECINYMTNRRRWIESVLFTLLFFYIIHKAVKRLDPIVVPPPRELNKPHSAIRLLLLVAMTFIFGIEMGFKFANQSVIFAMNPCHIQTMVQIYLLASKPSKTTIALFRIQMNNLNGPFLAFLFPEVECRTLPFEQATYWIQHALLYIIPVYILKSGAYEVEALNDFNWVTIGVMVMLIYHFVILNAFSIHTGINLNHMLCAALTDPFEGQNYRIAAVIHESILCPFLNKVTVLIFSSDSKHSLHNYYKKRPADLRLNKDTAALGDSSTEKRKPTLLAPSYQEHRSITPILVTPGGSAISELSLAAEMAAAVAGVDQVRTIRRRSHTNLQQMSLAAENGGMSPELDDDDDVEMDYEYDELSYGEEEQQQHQQQQMAAGAINDDYSMPTTKID